MLDLLPFFYVERVAVLTMTRLYLICKDSSDCLANPHKAKEMDSPNKQGGVGRT